MKLAPQQRAYLEALLLSDRTRQMRETLLRPLFDHQRNFIKSPARMKALFCSRRAGKTTLTPRQLFLSAIENKGTLARFWAISRLRAKELIWDELVRVNSELNADAKFNETELSVRLPDDSIIRLSGVDKLKEARKKAGDKLMLGIADEAQLYPDDAIKALVEDIASPALEDLQGTFQLLGTPGPVPIGYWWDITRDDGQPGAPGWEVHRWTVMDNPAFPVWAGNPDWRTVSQAWLAAMKAKKKWADDNPTYLREWCGRWVADVGALVYKYDALRNGYDGTLPELPDGYTWRHTAGSDLGVSDAFAIVVWAFSSAHPYAYEVYSEAGTELSVEEWETRWENVVKKYKPFKLRVDTAGYGKVIVEDILKRRQTRPGAITLPLESAEKHDKHAHQTLMNDDLLTGHLKIRRNGPLANEMRILPKDEDDPTKEDERYLNHCCDAGLYGWRDLMRMDYKNAPELSKPDQAKTDTYKAAVQKRMRERESKPWWDRARR